MEILSNTVFKGSVEIPYGGKLSVSEFELGNDKIQFHNGKSVVVLLKPGTMATTDQVNKVNGRLIVAESDITKIYSKIPNTVVVNPEIPANCTRFYFYSSHTDDDIAWVPRESDYPIVQVYNIPHNENDTFKLIQMDVDYHPATDSNYWNFIGNLTDHSNIISATEFTLVIRN